MWLVYLLEKELEIELVELMEYLLAQKLGMLKVQKLVIWLGEL